MTANVDLDTARAEYAQWFVKRHYLKKKRPYTGLGLGIDGVSRWRAAERQGYIRYYKQTRPPLKDSKGNVLLEGYESTGDEFNIDHWISLSHSERPEKSWWRIAIEDVDDPINDHNDIVRSYRAYRQMAEDLSLWEWLDAEAEYHVVTFEAWLRAYGVEVVNE